MNNLDKQYTALLQDILDNGVKKETRNGGTISVFGRQIRHKMSEGFPLLTTKKMYMKGIITELLWFLRGDTNIKYLVDNDCHIWDGDAYKNYSKTSINHITFSERNKHFKADGLEFNSGYPNYNHFTQEEFINKIKTDDEFAKKWGDLGPVYGKQWRNWGKGFKQIPNEEGNKVYHITTTGIDQIQNLINDLKTNPDSRRLMVNAWNVGEIDQCVLPPCHYGFQVYTRELNEKEGIKKLGLTVKYKGNNCKIISYHNANQELLMLSTPEGDRLVFEDGLDEPIDYSKIPTRAISLMWNQRSVDTFLGLPFNIASYGLLLEIIAKEVNMVPDELIGNLGDTHLYLNHIEQAKEQISREPFELPSLKIEDEVKWVEGDCLPYYSPSDFIVENYQSHPTIKAPLSN